MSEFRSESDLLDEMRGGQCRERVAVAQRLLAAGRLCQRRLSEAGDERTQWCIDNWDALAAEVGAELGISRGRASSQMHHGVDLVEHYPALTEAFLSGAVDYRVISMILFRAGLITDPDLQAEIDERLALACAGWNGLSHNRLTEVIDWVVREVDPAAVRVARQADEGRHVEMAPAGDGMADLWGKLRATDAAVFDRRLDMLAASVCGDDPRTVRQRRADAVGALACGAESLVCGCENPECPATANPTTAAVVIHVVATAETMSGQSETPAVLPGHGGIPAEVLRGLASRARVRPMIDPQARRGVGISAVGDAGRIHPLSGSDMSIPELRSPRGGVRSRSRSALSVRSDASVELTFAMPSSSFDQNFLVRAGRME